MNIGRIGSRADKYIVAQYDHQEKLMEKSLLSVLFPNVPPAEQHGGRSLSTRKSSWVQIPVLPLSTWVLLGQLLNLSIFLQNSDEKNKTNMSYSFS
jgi:hypothetical protein